MNTALATLNPISYKLFDKIINIALVHEDGSGFWVCAKRLERG